MATSEEVQASCYNNVDIKFGLHMEKIAARCSGDEASQISALRCLVKLMLEKELAKTISCYLDSNVEFSSVVLGLIAIDSSVEPLILVIPFICFLSEYNKKIVMLNWDSVFKVFKCLLEKLDSCSRSEDNSLLSNFWTKLVSCLYNSFPIELLKDARVVMEGLIEFGHIAKANHITRTFAMAGLHPKLLLASDSLNQNSLDSITGIVIDYSQEFSGLYSFSKSDFSFLQPAQCESIIPEVGDFPRSTSGSEFEQNLILVKRSFSSSSAQKTCEYVRKMNQIQSDNQFLQLKLVECKKLLESQKLENAKLLEVVRDLNVKLSSTKLKNDEIYYNFVSSEEYLEQLELQLKKVAEDLASEKKRFSNLFNENCAVKAKLFECSELKNKLARKVDTSVASELMLHKLSNEVFMMNELHLRYEEKLNLYSSMGANSDRHLDALLNYGSSSNNAGVVALKRNLEAEQKKNKELQRFVDEANEKTEKSEEELLSLKRTFENESEMIKTVVQKYEFEINELSEKLSKAGNRNSLLNSEIQLLKTKRKSDQREKCVGTQ